MNNENAKRVFIIMMIIAIAVAIYGYTHPMSIKNAAEVYYYISASDFADSDEDKKGDIRGIINSLDYLNDANPNTDSDLGITAIVLSGVNSSLSDAQNSESDFYDVVDFYNIDHTLGTMDDFSDLIGQAHKRGIKVIMSFDFNHTSIGYPWFKQAVASKESQLRNYYIFDDDKTADLSVKGPLGEEVWQRHVNYYYYSVAGRKFADLNYDNQDVRIDIKEIAAFYLEKGADGFRLEYPNYIYSPSQGLDAKMALDKNIDWWEEFKSACKEVKSDVILISDMPERSASAAPYFKGMDSNMNYFVAQKSVPALLSKYENMGKNPSDFTQQMDKIYSLYRGYNPDFTDAPFISSKKLGRITDTLSGDQKRAKMAAAIQLTLIGNPIIYYGDELGISDKNSSESEIISEEIKLQSGSDSSMLSFYKNLIEVKKENKALSMGEFTPVDFEDDKILIYIRHYKTSGQRLLIIHNLSAGKKSVNTQQIIKSDKKEIIFSSEERNEIDKAGNVWLQPLSSVIVEMK